MIKCPKCKSEIKVEKFSDSLVEVKCDCQKPRYFMNTGNDEEARLRFVDRVLGIKTPGKEKSSQVQTLGTREKFKKNPSNRKISEDNEILKYFSKKFTPRPIQSELWKEIQSCINSGYKKIVLSAPTGVGKSLLAAAVAKQMESSFIVTSTKSLQDQYTNDLVEFYPVKGASNFPCYKIMEQKKIPFDQIQYAVKKGFTCNIGSCTEVVIENGKEKKQSCKFKPKIEELQENNSGVYDCLYYTQKYLGLISAHSVWNYASYFQIIDQKDKFEEYLGRSVAIFDEAHKIEDQIIQFIGITITKNWLDECNIDVKHYDLTDIDMILSLLESLANRYTELIKKIKDVNQNSEYEKIGIIEGKYEKIVDGYKSISENKKNFIINKPNVDKNGDFKSISIQPLYISNYVNHYFQNPFQIFMSATIDKTSFCENLGWPQDEIAFIDTPKSPFRLENRSISFENIARLNYKSTENERLAAIKKIDDILTHHKNHRGLILTSSKSRCFNIFENLSPENKQRVSIWHSTDLSKKTIEQILKEHESKNDSVLLSSSLWEGVDLKDDLSRFQIIEKTPYADLSDKRVGIKMKIVPMWYQSMALMKLLQGFGRSIRNENDWAKTYVIDSAAQDLLERFHSRVPKAYHDVLGWN